MTTYSQRNPAWDNMLRQRAQHEADLEVINRLVTQYVDEIMQPGIPYVCKSHHIMRSIYGLVGEEAGDALIKHEMEKRQ